MRVPDDVFMRAWEEKSTAEETAEFLGLKLDTVRHRAMRLRRNGFPLRNKRGEIDYKELDVFVKAVLEGNANLTPREIVLLYLLGVKISRIAEIRGSDINTVLVALRRYRKCGVSLPRRNKQPGD